VVRDREGGATTSVFRTLQVPDFLDPRLAASSLHLMSAQGEFATVDQDYPPPDARRHSAEEAGTRRRSGSKPEPPEARNPFALPGGSSFQPTARRVFASGEEVLVFLQVVNLGRSEDRNGPVLTVTFDLRDVETGEVRLPSRQEMLIVDGARGRPCTLVYRLGLDGIDPGAYALRATVVDKVREEAVQQAEPIRIAARRSSVTPP